MTTGVFKYLDPATLKGGSGGSKPWSKVDTDVTSFSRTERRFPVANIRDLVPTLVSGSTAAAAAAAAAASSQNNRDQDQDQQKDPNPKFGTDVDVAGFAVYHAPAQEKAFTDDAAVRGGYYAEVEALLREKLSSSPTTSSSSSSEGGSGSGSGSGGGRVARVVIFDHTIRRRDPDSPRQPVQQVHVDQTPRAAEARVRRHVAGTGDVNGNSNKAAEEEVEALLRGRYQIINVWRPIGYPATDFPLGVVDWRTTEPEDLVAVDLMYPVRRAGENGSGGGSVGDGDGDDEDDRGKEVLPDPMSAESIEGYEVKGETYAVAPNDKHRFYYVKDMTPDEVMLIKCFDSRGQGLPGGRDGVAMYTPHTAFADPATPPGSRGRQSIEVRCLVFYDE